MQVSLEQFMAQLTECGLLPQAELTAVIEGMPPEQRPKDPTALAKELIRLGKLTPYQAKAVYQGKGANLVLGNYVVMDKLGQGGMGMVLKACHRRMDRIVALKVLFSRVVKTPGAIERFHREVKAAARLTHPNIVTAYDADEVNQTHFLVMEFVEGADLAQLVAQKGPLPPAEAADCVMQAAKGLAYAHSQGVIHRDIKPANLLLDRHGVVRILDLGMARLDATGDADLTESGQIMGTVNYMAPEQSLNTKNTDARSDIYSLGMTLWFLLTGRPAYEGSTLVETLIAHRERPIPSLRAVRPDVSPGLEAIFTRMVAKSPDGRFANMTELIAALETCAAPSGPPPIDPGVSVLEGWNADSLSGSGLSMPSLSGLAQPRLQSPPQVHGAHPDNTLASMGDSTDHSQMLTAELVPQPQIHAEHTPVSVAYRKSRGSWLPIVGGLVILAAIAAAAVVFLLPTSEGTLVVEVNEPGAVVKVLDDQGTVEITDASGQKKVQLSVKPGSKQITVTKDGFTIHSQNLTISKGGEELLKVSLQPKQVAENNPGPGTPVTPGGTPSTPSTPGGTPSTPGGTPVTPPMPTTPTAPPTSVRTVAADGSLIFTIDLNDLPPELTQPRAGSSTQPPSIHGSAAGDERDDNSLQLKMVWCPPGSFKMGDRTSAVDVTLSSGFWVGKTEVTQSQWQAVIGTEPWRADSSVPQGSDYPASFVSYEDATEFCNKLTETERAASRLPLGWKYALPTEAQWEYACRAHTTSTYSFSDESQLDQYAWYKQNALLGGQPFPHQVGQKRPNPWGIFDMHGNLREWCRDWLRGSLAGGIDPETTAIGEKRVRRGGCWSDGADACTCSFRDGIEPTFRNRCLGFRVALVAIKSDASNQTGSVSIASSTPIPNSPQLPVSSGIGSQSGETWFVSAGAPGQVNYSLELLNRGYVSVPNFKIPTKGPLTIEAYVLPSRHSANRGAIVMGPGVYLGGQESTEWRCGHVLENGSWQSMAAAAMTLRGWQHIAGVWADEELRLFVNGKRVATAPRNSNALAFNQFLIGAASVPQLSDHFRGNIDEIRISSVARYSSDFTPQPRFEADPQTLALYHCDDGSGNVLTDSSGKSHHGQIFAAEWSPVQAAGLPETLPLGQRAPVTPASLAKPWVRAGTPTRYWSNYIITSSGDSLAMFSWLESKVAAYDIGDGKKFWEFTPPVNSLTAPAMSADGNLLAWNSAGAINVVDMRGKGHLGVVAAVEYAGNLGFSLDGKFLLSRAQKALSVFELPSLERKRTFNLDATTNGRELIFHPDGDQVLIPLSVQMTDRTSVCRLIHLKTGAEQTMNWPCRPIGFTKDGSGIVVLTNTGVGVLDTRSSQIRLLSDNLRKRLPPLYTATYDPASQLFAGYNSVPTPQVTLWNLNTGKLLAEVPVASTPKLAVLGEGKALAILDRDRLHIWAPSAAP